MRSSGVCLCVSVRIGKGEPGEFLDPTLLKEEDIGGRHGRKTRTATRLIW